MAVDSCGTQPVGTPIGHTRSDQGVSHDEEDGLGLCIAALTVTACGTPASHSGSAPTGVNAGSAGDSEQTSGSDTQSADAAFGTAYTWDDGLSVEVVAPKAFTPSEYAAGTEGYSQFVRFTVRIVNGTSENWDPSLLRDAPVGQPGGQPGV